MSGAATTRTFRISRVARSWPLAVFVESVRPLGSLKYEGQFNYFASAFSGSAPTLETMTYEYVFADWNAARVEIVSPKPGSVDALGLGYQRTLGVGENPQLGARRVGPPGIIAAGYAASSAARRCTRWPGSPKRSRPGRSADRSGPTGPRSTTAPSTGASDSITGDVGSLMMRMGGGSDAADRPEAEEESRVWRTFAAGNLWYTFTPKVTVGLEIDAYVHNKFGEYLVQPNITYRPTKHFFAQAGVGYYEIGGKSQGGVHVAG